MNASAFQIIPLEASHLERASSLLGEAFLNEPGALSIIRGTPEKRLRMLRAHYASHVKLNLSRRASCCALLNGEIVGVMLMCAPGEVTATTGETLVFLARALLDANPAIVWRGLRNNVEDEKHRPKEPNYFLETIGVDPKLQRRGIGSMMLSYLAGLADRGLVLTYLSTTDPRTIPFYEKFGFQTKARTNPTGVPNYHMVRLKVSLEALLTECLSFLSDKCARRRILAGYLPKTLFDPALIRLSPSRLISVFRIFRTRRLADCACP